MTELESTILAVIVRDGPVSAYGVRKVFDASSTPSWSSSTGAIYPCVRRLIAMGLVTTSAPTGARRQQLLSATPKGRAAVRAWICDVQLELGAASPDPIRTRAFFLRTLPGSARLAFIDRALAATADALDEVRRETVVEEDAGVDPFVVAAGRGAAYELRARRRWLLTLREMVSADHASAPEANLRSARTLVKDR